MHKSVSHRQSHDQHTLYCTEHTQTDHMSSCDIPSSNNGVTEEYLLYLHLHQVAGQGTGLQPSISSRCLPGIPYHHGRPLSDRGG